MCEFGCQRRDQSFVSRSHQKADRPGNSQPKPLRNVATVTLVDGDHGISFNGELERFLFTGVQSFGLRRADLQVADGSFDPHPTSVYRNLNLRPFNESSAIYRYLVPYRLRNQHQFVKLPEQIESAEPCEIDQWC